MKKPTDRFSHKVQNYVKYRPGYPKEVLEYLKSKGELRKGSCVVDIGSGTGIFTKLLLDEGYKVYAVEPNNEMREAAEKSLHQYKQFISVAAAGEQTTLDAGVADLIVSATAFHWLDPVKAKAEFARILKPSKKVALIWNIRRADADEFSNEYERFWRNSERATKHDVAAEELISFFSKGQFETRWFHHSQEFDLEGLIGRSFSSSFSPEEGTPEAVKFIELVTDLFNKYNRNGRVQVYYTAKVYTGRVE